MRPFSVLLLVLILVAPLWADTLFLKSNEKIVGEILEETSQEIKIKTEEEVLVIPKTMIEEIEQEIATVVLNNGKELKGKVVNEDSNSITLRMRFGDIKILKDEIEPDGITKKMVREKPYIWSVSEIKEYETKKQVSRLTIDEVEFPPQTENLGAEEIQALHQNVHQLFEKKKYREAIEVLQKILRSAPTDQVAWYNLACAYSLLNDKKKAVEALLLAVKAGYTDFMHMENDSDLDNIRKTKEYEQLLKERDRIQKEAAARTLEQLKKQFGEGYTYAIDEERKLIFATNQSLEVLNQLKQRLYNIADALWNDFFTHRPLYYITIVCPSQQDYRKMVPNPAIGGFYNPGTRVLVAGSIGGVLDHEFCHALHFADQHGRKGQAHPIWICEGFATLLETAKCAGGHCMPHRVNYRLQMLQAAVRSGRHVPLAQFVNLPQQIYVQNAGVCYAEGRYIMMFLWEKKLLRKWYDAYTDAENFKKDQSGVLALEKVFGKPLQQIEDEWKAWLLAISQNDTREKKTELGLTVGECEKGVFVVSTESGSPSDKKLLPGDMLLVINGKKIDDMSDLDSAMSGVKKGSQVKFSISREVEIKGSGGKKQKKEQKMDVTITA
ncbi:MAG: PDZ domain-containing protein [Planctomycetota bacterium]|nr:PDZ domain-containing protein [Planctomycetota bacterium]